MSSNFLRTIVTMAAMLMSVGYSGHAQTDSTANFKRNFGYGVSNLGHLYDFKTYTPGIYLEFGQRSPIEGWDYNIKMIGQYSLSSQNNLRTHALVPFIVTIGLEKGWFFEKFIIYFNADIFYSMSLRKATLGTFQGDDYGIGLSPGINLTYPFRENLSIQVGMEYGVGLFREFVSVGTVAAPAMVLDFVAIRSLSLGLRHYF